MNFKLHSQLHVKAKPLDVTNTRSYADADRAHADPSSRSGKGTDFSIRDLSAVWISSQLHPARVVKRMPGCSAFSGAELNGVKPIAKKKNKCKNGLRDSQESGLVMLP